MPQGYHRSTMAIYLDHAATSPLRPEVLEAMLPYLTTQRRQPVQPPRDRAARAQGHRRGARGDRGGSSAHSRARSSSPPAAPRPTTWRSRAAAWAATARGRHLVTTAVEHKAVLNTIAILERANFEVIHLPVDRYGRVDPVDVAAALTERTTLVSVMAANNEVGTLQPIAEIGEIVRGHGAKLPRRRGPVGGARADRRRRLAGRPRQPLGAQAGRAAGRRRALRPARDPAPAAAPGRLAGAPATGRDRERGRHRRVRGGLPPGAGRRSPRPIGSAS